MGLNRMAEGQFSVNAITIASPVALPFNVAALLEIRDDPLHRAFGDADPLGHLADPDIRVAGQDQKHVGMVAQKRPGRIGPRLPPRLLNRGRGGSGLSWRLRCGWGQGRLDAVGLVGGRDHLLVESGENAGRACAGS